ncbi:acyl carrier protein (plasmid) [Streptomyces decoyicus]|uniref:acyl carrier protein n=1 Tax=Streptomyces decoyicus TaxID=249567 RepID=UPI002E33E6FF|nr:acyl carrier protein [Streptomyces decoyicus]
MNEPMVSEVIADELRKQGYPLSRDEYRTDLIGAGVNSVNLIRLLSSLEDLFDIDFEAAQLFSDPVTVARIAEVILAHTAQTAEGKTS